MPLDTLRIKILDSKLQNLKHGIMVIGDTGVGKSTFILTVLGYPLTKKQVGHNTMFVSTKKLLPEHEPLRPTLNITSVTKDILPYKRKFNTKDIYILDTPGFCDTKGQEKDL